MSDFQMHGHSYQRARKSHACYGCGSVIPIGEKYWRCVVIADGRVKTVKTCRSKCETFVDMFDQNQRVAAEAIGYPTFPAYMKDNPDAFKG